MSIPNLFKALYQKWTLQYHESTIWGSSCLLAHRCSPWQTRPNVTVFATGALTATSNCLTQWASGRHYHGESSRATVPPPHFHNLAAFGPLIQKLTSGCSMEPKPYLFLWKLLICAWSQNCSTSRVLIFHVVKPADVCTSDFLQPSWLMFSLAPGSLEWG